MDLNFPFLLSSYLTQLPAILVLLVGIVLALARWSRHPQVSLTALIAFAIFLLRALAGPLISFAIIRGGAGAARIGFLQGLANLGASLVGLAAWVLILAAIFGWRRREG